jgi:Uri superfamily endonuclease
MRLEKRRRIRIGRFGEFFFEPGRYVYVGSAFGPGGLKRRTDRHRRLEKRQHWHIDFLREIAPIHEIWFSHGSRDAEHDWARILAQMEGARVPVAGFGSQDCRSGCPSHLICFAHLPAIAVFRSNLRSWTSSHVPVYVDVATPMDEIALESG